MSLRSQLQNPIVLLSSALDDISTAYQGSIPPLLARPALVLFGYISSSLYLLEHMTWSHSNGEPGRDTDVEVFKRWVEEGGLVHAVEDMKRAKGAGDERAEMDLRIVYGLGCKVKL